MIDEKKNNAGKYKEDQIENNDTEKVEVCFFQNGVLLLF